MPARWPLGFPCGSDSKKSASNAGVLGSTLGGEDPLEKEMTTYSSILAWRIPWAEDPGGLQSVGFQRVGHTWVTNTERSRTSFGHLWFSFSALFQMKLPTHSSHIKVLLFLRKHHVLDFGPLNILFYVLGIFSFPCLLGFFLFIFQGSA